MDLEILRNIPWLLSQNPNEAEMYLNADYDNPVPLSAEVKNSILFESEIIINLPTHRYAETFNKLNLKGPITVFNLLTSLFDFYQSSIPAGGLDNSPDDVWKNISNAKLKMQEGDQVKWIDIMGDLQFFEGLCESTEEANGACAGAAEKSGVKVYDLILGS